MYKDLLPIGSVVLLKGGQNRIMITGRVLCKTGDTTIYDYSGILYPIGVTGTDDTYFFFRDAIEKIFFIGFQDQEELEFKEKVLDNLGELQVIDGKIVPKE